MAGNNNHTADEVRQRREAVLEAFALGDWSIALVDRLAEQWGVTRRQIYNDRQAVLDEMREMIDLADRERNRLELLARSRALFARCAADPRTASVAAKLLHFDASVTGAYAPVEVNVHHQSAAMSDEDLARLILQASDEEREWAERVLAPAREPLRIVDAQYTEADE